MPPETAIPINALALLDLPPHSELTQAQARGVACVWCATGLDTATAVDLGAQRHSHYSAFPRACAACVAKAADQTLRAHAGMCEQCVDDTDRCGTATVLRQLVEAHR
ncbi:MAG TPA: hypothetical protein VIU15_06305 [Streptomyces sp.]